MSENNAYGRKVPSSDAKKFELAGFSIICADSLGVPYNVDHGPSCITVHVRIGFMRLQRQQWRH